MFDGVRLVLCMAVLTLATCDRADREHVGTGGGPVSLESMRDAPSTWTGLARLRCERMQRCGELGPSAKYDDYESCVATERRALQVALPRHRCASFEEDPLRECAQAAGGGACEDAHDDESFAANLGSCAAERLCVSDR